mmetsp:Transcript_2319/g.7381  ORF Transcript_2319/g.7381 Transcript_2319/m.7381 type:complete len:128 (+) Transcript_2319:76-459(+)
MQALASHATVRRSSTGRRLACIPPAGNLLLAACLASADAAGLGRSFTGQVVPRRASAAPARALLGSPQTAGQQLVATSPADDSHVAWGFDETWLRRFAAVCAAAVIALGPSVAEARGTGVNRMLRLL